MTFPLKISAFTLVNALGRGAAASLSALRNQRSGLQHCDYADVRLDTWIGRVMGLEDAAVCKPLVAYDCRNNRLAQMALTTDGFDSAVAAARTRYGATRIGVFVGTSTSGIRQTELAYAKRGQLDVPLPNDFYYRQTHNIFSVTDFTRRYLALEGVATTHAAACASSAKVFVSAARHIQAGFCDAAVIGGVDSLCLTTLYGFHSLELISAAPCRPWDAQRDGINIGEAAGFALLEKSPAAEDSDVFLLGYGESSDAYHMSTPHPKGEGAALAIQKALRNVDVSQVDYINLHGTATRSNDSSEDQAIISVFGTNTPCSSTKGWTGHTLGAAGITEALFSVMGIQEGFMPATLNLATPDPKLSAHVLQASVTQPISKVLSNSFGFGGNNCSLLLGKES